MDISHCAQDGLLFWDVPEGNWRIFFMVSTREGGEGHTKDYLNPLEGEAVRLFLHYVYEAHYDRYKEDFGKTIAGFFSDEPRFGNASSYECFLGNTNNIHTNYRQKVVIPWSRNLLDQLGEDFKKDLPLLWYDGGEHTAQARYTYMDLVSRLFGQNYTQQIGDWCRAHKVKYIGHVIEENGAHARLGYGAGHFFRSIRGQDYPGLDLIHQVWPGMTEGRFRSQVGFLDADFFYWGITKMTSSAAHITHEDSGVSICEIFGAYGWQAGLKMMKWLTDHLCVRGINQLVPHAFSPKACDWDAPPHFYDCGLNPQWRYFHIWSRYANRLCHLLNGGTHIATAAVLYHAEAEWTGEYMPFELPAKALLRNQIDCDIVPIDTFAEGRVKLGEGVFSIGGETYRVMVVPYAQKMPKMMLQHLQKMAQANIPVIFIRDLPQGSPLENEDCADVLEDLKKSAAVCSCEHLAEEIFRRNLQDVTVSAQDDFLRIYHYSQPDGQVYFVTNEAPQAAITTHITLQETGIPVFYDAMENTLCLPEYTKNGDTVTLQMALDAYQSRFIILFPDESALEAFRNAVPQLREEKMLRSFAGQGLIATLQEKGWQVSSSQAPETDVFTARPEITSLGNLIVPGGPVDFTGTFRYETEFALNQLPQQDILLDLGRAYETAEVWINGQPAGSRIAPPYCFPAAKLLKEGKNTIRVDITNTLVRQRGQNLLDRDMAQEPVGLIGPVRLFTL